MKQYVGPFYNSPSPISSGIISQVISKSTSISSDSYSVYNPTIASGVLITVNTGVLWTIK